MNETAQEYIERILSNAHGANPWDVLTSTPGRLRELVESRDESDLARKPAPDRWSIREILAHLADAEVVIGWRLRSILASNGTKLQAYDQSRWADTFKYADVAAGDSLDSFEASRRANMRLLRTVDPALLENFGMHEERGRESITHLIKLNAG